MLVNIYYCFYRQGFYVLTNFISKFTRKKYEIATDEEFTPIKQDEKKGKLREVRRLVLANPIIQKIRRLLITYLLMRTTLTNTVI